MFTAEETRKLAAMQELLDVAYQHYFTHSNGICKSSEGVIAITGDTHFDRSRSTTTPTNPRLSADENATKHRIVIYSSVFGAGNSSEFDSIDAALAEVTHWHREEINTEYDTAGDPVGMWD